MTGGAPEPLDLNGFLPYRLSVLANRISGALARLYAEQFDLSIPEWRVMAVLGQAPGMSADEVAARTQMDKVSVSRAVARLMEKRALDRSFAKQDRRRSELRLSRRGYAMYARIIPQARELDRQLQSALTATQRRELFGLLSKLDEGVAAMLGDAAEAP